MKLNHLRDVLAVAQYGSLRSAGRHLGIAQPAITRSIREIESELGVSLFERGAKGVRVTNIGAAFLRRAEAVRAELQRARDEIAQMKGATTGEVSIALSTASSMALMPAVLTNFRRRYPDVLLKISESLYQSVEPALIDGTLDFYIGPITLDDASSALEVERLFETRRLVIARRGHPLAHVRMLSDLGDVHWVWPTLSPANADDFEAIFARRGLPPPSISVHGRSALITLLVVANSDLLTILPQQWLDFPATANMLTALDLDEVLLAPPVCIVRRRDMPLTPVAEHLCDLMRRRGQNYALRTATD